MGCTVYKKSCLAESAPAALSRSARKPNVRTLSLSDRDWVTKILQAENSLSSDGCFGTLYLWGRAYGLRVTKLGDRLLLRYRGKDGIYFAYPVGSGELKSAVRTMKQATLEQGVPLVIRRLTEKQKQNLEHAFPDRFSFTENRDAADYIYEAQALAQLAGKKLHSKRNHCNRFEKLYPDWRFECLQRHHFPACLALLDQWEGSHETGLKAEQTAERAAIMQAFADYEALGLDGGILFAENKPVAFSIGELLGQDGFDVRFEKADTAFDGSYAMINRAFARYLTEKYPKLQYMNREEDMGLESLRKAKLSYYPVFLLTKYDAQWD